MSAQRHSLRLSDVAMEPLDWLWPGYLAAGKLTLFDGDPDQGKSLLTLDLAARLTSARPMPDGYQPPRCESVILLGGEDGIQDTVVPRLKAAGADLSRVHHFQGETRPDGLTRLPIIPDDTAALRQALKETGARLLVCDPFLGLLGDRAGCVNGAAVRSVLNPLAQLAEQTGAAPVMVRHLSKGGGHQRALYRGSGSMAIIGAARIAFLVGRDPRDRDLRLLACIKNNLAPTPPTLSYRIRPDHQGRPVIDWAGAVPITAQDLVLADGERFGASRLNAVVFLRETLAAGPRPRLQICADAQALDISERTLERAKAELGVSSHAIREGGRNVWYWGLTGGSTNDEDRGSVENEVQAT